MDGFKHDLEPSYKVSDYTTDKDQNKVRITFKVYDEPVVESEALKMLSSLEIEYVEPPKELSSSYYCDTIFFPVKLSKEEISKSMEYAKTNIDNYKSKQLI